MNTVMGPDSMEKAFERMVSQHQLSLLRLCYAFLHDEEQAKDAVQETFLKAYRNMDQFDKKSAEKTWLNRIAINVCKDMHRSGWFLHMDRRVTPDMLPETEAQTEEEFDCLTAAIMDLPVRQREAALLCWLQGMTYSEAGEALGITHQAVSKRLNHARKKLHIVLEGGDDHDAV